MEAERNNNLVKVKELITDGAGFEPSIVISVSSFSYHCGRLSHQYTAFPMQ